MNFKTTAYLFIIIILVMSLLVYYSAINIWLLLIPVLLFKGVVIYGSATINSGFFTKVYCSSATTKKEIAITFDDGPHEKFTQEILSVLNDYKAKATFFLIGKRCINQATIVKQIIDSGHCIGNHTYSHSFFIDFKNKRAFKKELLETSETINKFTGKQIRFFRPPYGVTTPGLAKAAHALDYDIIGWNIRSFDTSNESEEIIAARVIGKLAPGSIILLHDTSEKTVHVLRQILKFVQENNFRIVNLEQLLNLEAYRT